MHSADSTLTFSEARVLLLLLQGTKPSDIGRQLGVKVSTIRTHIRHLHAKSETHSLVELASWATRNLENGVLMPLYFDPKWSVTLDEFLT